MSIERSWAIKRWYLGWDRDKPIYSVDETRNIDRLFYRGAKNTEYWQSRAKATFLMHPFPSELYYFEETPFKDNWYPTFFFYCQKIQGDNPECRFEKEHQERFLQFKTIGFERMEREITKRSSPKEFTDKLLSLCKHICEDNYQNFDEFVLILNGVGVE